MGTVSSIMSNAKPAPPGRDLLREGSPVGKEVAPRAASSARCSKSVGRIRHCSKSTDSAKARPAATRIPPPDSKPPKRPWNFSFAGSESNPPSPRIFSGNPTSAVAVLLLRPQNFPTKTTRRRLSAPPETAGRLSYQVHVAFPQLFGLFRALLHRHRQILEHALLLFGLQQLSLGLLVRIVGLEDVHLQFELGEGRLHRALTQFQDPRVVLFLQRQLLIWEGGRWRHAGAARREGLSF